jgi:hypothetical protein
MKTKKREDTHMELNPKESSPPISWNLLEDNTHILSKSVKHLKKAQKNWDFRFYEQMKQQFQESLNKIKKSWEALEPYLENEMTLHKEFVTNEQFIKDFEHELAESNILFQGKFPDYIFPPYHLHFDLENYQVLLILGRKSKRFSVLQPQELAILIANEYKAIYNRRFNSKIFLKDLLNAYKIANCLSYKQKEALWGKAVSLDKIYEILTVRRSTHQEYPKIFFQFELGLLKERFDLSLNEEYVFEFGFTRSARKALVILDSQGRESRISTLTIYKEERPHVD